MQNERARGTPEQRIREIKERLVRSVDPQEQTRLKAELVGYILHAQRSRQQYALREFAAAQ